MNVVQAIKLPVQERYSNSNSFFTVEVSRRNQKIEIHLANEEYAFAIFSMDLGSIFGIIFGNEFGVKLKERGPHKLESAYDIVRVHSLMIYTDLIEYKIVCDAETPLLLCFSIIS